MSEPLSVTLDHEDFAERERGESAIAATKRRDTQLRLLFDEHFAFIWRYLRRLGLSESDADDAGQKVFHAASRRPSPIAVHIFAATSRSF